MLRRRILIALLLVGVVGGYASGIRSMVLKHRHGDDDGSGREGCRHARWGQQE